MNNRDLIVRTLARVHNQRDTPIPADVLESWQPYADAVLYVLGDRLLPDVPREVEMVAVDLVFPEGWSWRMHTGSGKTVAEAVTNALEGQP